MTACGCVFFERPSADDHIINLKEILEAPFCLVRSSGTFKISYLCMRMSIAKNMEPITFLIDHEDLFAEQGVCQVQACILAQVVRTLEFLNIEQEVRCDSVSFLRKVVAAKAFRVSLQPERAPFQILTGVLDLTDICADGGTHERGLF
jgi:hypothetical protein